MAEKEFRILFAEPFSQAVVDRMREVGAVTVLDRCDEATLLESVVDCDALLVRSSARITAAVIDAAKRLRVIGRAGVGLERIDLEAAHARGVTVVYSPAASTEAVADLAVGLMIGVLRNICGADAMIRAGRFHAARSESIGPELRDLTLGIVGLGRIGQAVAQRCHRGFGMRLLYNDIKPPGPLDFEALSASKTELFRESDVVSLHVPLTTATRGLIDRRSLACFKKNAILINTSRGAVVDHDALAVALSSGKLGGAGLDVFDIEPLPADDPLLSAPHTILTPHIGARTAMSLQRMEDVVEDVVRVLHGAKPVAPA